MKVSKRGLKNKLERKLKMLTKEECLEALTEIKMYGGINIPLYSLEVIENLIDEHFDNPPLEWEELKEGMFVWDDIDKEYRKVYGKGIYLGDEYLMKTGCKVVFISEDEYFNLIYEPNRFYRKEVQE